MTTGFPYHHQRLPPSSCSSLLTMASSSSPVVLVTGVNGYIASAAARQFLAAGYRGIVTPFPCRDHFPHGVVILLSAFAAIFFSFYFLVANQLQQSGERYAPSPSPNDPSPKHSKTTSPLAPSSSSRSPTSSPLVPSMSPSKTPLASPILPRPAFAPKTSPTPQPRSPSPSKASPISSTRPRPTPARSSEASVYSPPWRP